MSRTLTRIVVWSGQPYVLGETSWGEELETRNVVVKRREGICLQSVQSREETADGPSRITPGER